MATARMAAPRTKRGPQNLVNIGVEGRATALTMAERPKDEHGMELMDNWYSSPAKIDPQLDRLSGKRKSNKISNDSPELAEVDQNIAFDSARVSGRLTREMRKSLPPPPGRSPIKTNLGATPMRGTPRATMSPPRPQSQDNHTPKSPRRLLDFSVSETSRSTLRSGSKARLSDRRPNTYTPRFSHGEMNIPSATQEIHVSPAISHAPQDQSELHAQQHQDLPDSPPPGMGDDVDMMPQQLEDQTDHQMPDREQEDEQEQEEQSTRNDTLPDVDDTVASIETSNIIEPDHVEGAFQQPAPSPEVEVEQPLQQKDVKRRPFSKKDPNSKRKAPATKGSKPTQPHEPSAPPRPLQRKRAQTPAESDGVLQTRSGRNVYKPLAYWKGEHALFEDHTYQQNLKQIIRMEEVTPRKQPTNIKKKKRKYTVFEDPETEEQTGEEPWEISEGIVSAPVRTWDPDQNTAPPGSEFEQQLAFASARIQPRASPDNPNFFFTKTLTMPFFGAGVIEIPPGGHKGMKNSRKFQFIFFVHYGKVDVEIAGTSFTITKGGMWQVPRGNFYSMSNQTEHPAKIFFAQSCELQPEPAAVPLLENLN